MNFVNKYLDRQLTAAERREMSAWLAFDDRRLWRRNFRGTLLRDFLAKYLIAIEWIRGGGYRWRITTTGKERRSWRSEETFKEESSAIAAVGRDLFLSEFFPGVDRSRLRGDELPSD